MDELKRIFEQNKRWVLDTNAKDPGFFARHANGQSPHSLFIGCSDSRVAADAITGTRGGELFVHRNIANQAIPSDLNMLAVLQYAVDVLKVRHVIVCGHYGCGGVKAAQDLPTGSHGLVDQWLSHVRQVLRIHEAELESLPEERRYPRLVELNVLEQVNNLRNTSVVQAAWNRGQELKLTGWVYSLSDGLLRSLEPELETVG